MAGYFEHGKSYTSSKRGEEFRDQLRDYQFLKYDSVSWCLVSYY